MGQDQLQSADSSVRCSMLDVQCSMFELKRTSNTERPTLNIEQNHRVLLIGWFLVGFAVLIGTQLCSTIWAFANPAPHHWDNADYLNLAYNDLWSYTYGGPENHRVGMAGVWDSLINADHNRPPGYRIVSLPFVFLGVRMLPMLRGLSLGVFWVTLYLIYRTVAIVIDGPAGKIAGIVAAALTALYLEVGWSVRLYGTEYTLYFSVALMLFCLARSTRAAGNDAGTWTGLGFALGLGILSKLSFVLLALPVGCVVLTLVLFRQLPGLSVLKLIGALAIGCLMAWPYYRYHIFETVHYGQEMMLFQRHSLNQSGAGLLRSWFRLHMNEGLGLRASWIVLMLLLVVGLRVLIGARKSGSSAYLKTGLGKPAGSMILIALSAGIPILVFQVVYSHSNNVRHMTPAYFPLTIALAVAAGATGTLVSWWSWIVLIGFAYPAFVQVNSEFIPLTNTPDDVWNWEPVFQVCQAHHLRWPYIGRVGNAGQFCEPSIVYPWMKRGDWANCMWLWRSEEGAFNWKKVQAELADRDVVLTAPGFHVPRGVSALADPFELDNSHNDEFVQHLLADPQWELANKFSIGVINPAEIWVFVRKVRLARQQF